MPTVLVYIGVLAVSALLGAFAGNIVGLLCSALTKSEYGLRLLRGLTFGSATVVVAFYILRALGRPVHLAFGAALIGTFIVLAVLNRLKVQSAMRTHAGDAGVHAKLSVLSQTRLVQDLAAAVSALIGLLIGYGSSAF